MRNAARQATKMAAMVCGGFTALGLLIFAMLEIGYQLFGFPGTLGAMAVTMFGSIWMAFFHDYRTRGDQ